MAKEKFYSVTVNVIIKESKDNQDDLEEVINEAMHNLCCDQFDVDSVESVSVNPAGWCKLRKYYSKNGVTLDFGGDMIIKGSKLNFLYRRVNGVVFQILYEGNWHTTDISYFDVVKP